MNINAEILATLLVLAGVCFLSLWWHTEQQLKQLKKTDAITEHHPLFLRRQQQYNFCRGSVIGIIALTAWIAYVAALLIHGVF